jgi:hypothetical protein
MDVLINLRSHPYDILIKNEEIGRTRAKRREKKYIYSNLIHFSFLSPFLVFPIKNY